MKTFKRIEFILMSLVFTFTLSSCGDKAATVVGSCSFTQGYCWDFTADFAADKETSCTDLLGTYSASACTATGLVGSCTISTGDSAGTITRYYEDSFSGITARAACELFEGSYSGS